MNLWKQKFKPMLLSEIDKPFNSDKYLFEIKYDGVRVLVYVSPTSIKVINRNLNDMTHLFPELIVLKNKVSKKVIFDCEIISLVDGMPSFGKLQERIHLKNKSKIIHLAKEDPITLIVFDIIYEDKDLTNQTLLERKEYLKKYNDDEIFVKSYGFENEGIKLFKQIEKLGLEGIVAKKKEGKYYINTRSHEWIKIKNFKTEEFYICGYVEKKSKYVLSLLLGEYQGNKLYYVGNVSYSKKNPLYNEIIKSKLTKNNFENYSGVAKYIKPYLKVTVSYMERTKSNNLRQPFIKNKDSHS